MKIKYLLLCLAFLLPSVSQAATKVCYCVLTLRQRIPETPTLDAKYWSLLPQQTRSAPTIGSIVLLQFDDGTYDVQTVVGYNEKGFLVWGLDWDCYGTSYKTISYNDSKIVSFFYFG